MLVKSCKEQERRGQQFVYEKYSGKMMGVCKRYLGHSQEAEDTLIEGFMIVFSKVESFNEQGSFEGWIKRIMINCSLMKIRKKGNLYFQNTDEILHLAAPDDILSQLNIQEILALISQIPIGYRTVFNLYAIEGFNHREISEKLGISEGTSKSQLSRARGLIQKKINELQA